MRATGRPRRQRKTRFLTRVGLLLAAGTTSLLTLAGTASAHVTAQPGAAAQGGYSEIAFRTPNERDNAGTVKLEVFFPADHPIASVAVEPLPGWTVTVDKSTLATPIRTDDGEVTQAVSKITWAGGRLGSGQFQDFRVSLGPLPTNTDALVFKAVQTYDDGEVVRWIDQPAPAGQPEPEHPAPIVHLTAVSRRGDTADSAGSSGESAGLALGIAGIVLGLAGVLLGGLALRRASAGH
jgi:uncharacterized protein YcnI